MQGMENKHSGFFPLYLAKSSTIGHRVGTQCANL